VHPSRRREGLGCGTLRALTEAGTECALPAVTTAEIPSAASDAHTLFSRAGWQTLPGPYLLRGPISTTPGPPSPGVHSAVNMHDGLADALARLYTATYPSHGGATATDTLRRWSRDHRFTPAGLLLTGPPGNPTAAALVYPLAHSQPQEETSELLIADLLLDTTRPAGEQTTTAAALAHAALRHAGLLGCVVARAVLPASSTVQIAALEAAGLAVRDRFALYQPRPMEVL
jgi:hypothetical protein